MLWLVLAIIAFALHWPLWLGILFGVLFVLSLPYIFIGDSW